MKRSVVALGALILVLSGCGQARQKATSPAGGPQAGQEDRQTADLKLRLVFSGKQQVQSVVPRYTRDSVDHVVLKVFESMTLAELAEQGMTDAMPPDMGDASGDFEVFVPLRDSQGNSVTVSVGRSDLDDEIRYSRLNLGKRYIFDAYAYSSQQESDSSLISSPSALFLDRATLRGQPQILAILLKDSEFAAGGGAMVSISGGALYTVGEPAAVSPIPLPTLPPGTVYIDPAPSDPSQIQWEWGSAEFGE